MAVAPVLPVLLIVILAKCQCEPTNIYNYNSNNGKTASHFGNILKPPPLLPILPVPFHGGTGKIRQNNDFGYQYQATPPQPPPAPPIAPATDFKFPAPFYRQYNFNFVPAPQPFTTTPSPNLFQKVSSWLFPSQQTASELEPQINYNYNIAPLKKDCNPCNLVPWIPVIRYDLASDSGRQSNNPTYGPPSPTAKANAYSGQNVPVPFNTQNNNVKQGQISTGVPHTSYGPPGLSQFRIPSSTYGPPSPTHTINIASQTPPSAPYSDNSSHEPPNTSIGSGSNFQPHNSPYSTQDSAHQSSPFIYTSPSLNYRNPVPSTTHNPVSTGYNPEILNQHLPVQNNIDEFREIEPATEFQLPKVTHPTGFRNSYGEPIVNTYHLDYPYSVSAAGAASSKIKTEVLPDKFTKAQGPNTTMALSNPAPFSLNRGRNIHTLQPVALPNLSVSPLPPIFNARPFRTVSTKYPPNIVQGINHLQSGQNKVNIAKSVPVAEYTQSIEYPTTFIQSPVIDIDQLRNMNQSKAYRNIANGHEIDEIRDISPQASEDHISAAKSNPDISFESIGFTNDLYDASVPFDLQQSSKVPFNHKVSFADLRGVKDEDVDKYRTESNLQYIDSPLLYLKPSAPHKNYKNFAFSRTTPSKENEYEIYDDIPTTLSPTQTTFLNTWDTSRTHDTEDLSHTTAEEENKNHPKIVQIIVPYTNGKKIYDDIKNKFSPSQIDFTNNDQEYQARKIQSNTESSFITVATEGYSNTATTETPMATMTDHYDTERLNTPAVDFYDVKEPPFDIIKLQHTIDDWTEQEYSKHYNIPQKTRSNEKYAKQIPDEYFTTISPVTNFDTEISNYNFDSYDHEGSSSIQYTVTENRTNSFPIKRKEYNVIEMTKNSYNTDKNEVSEGPKKLHIYTAASTFRSAKTTTPAPWGHIQTSISPLTNEKVYVVTSKPWRENNITKEYDYGGENLELKKEEFDDDSSLDDLSFHSPRFSNRPSYGFTADSVESTKLESPYGYSKGWHRRINNLEYPNSSSFEEDSDKETKEEKTSKAGSVDE
ncbi:uncharacterized protein LOC125077951 [Vanessa atalanta]|uniref:uncharacterized protein LOC125077951 n=1 Tax=Vanessa atalanta TaxID=42275 RepID=UPI001FCDD97B|nr:uncharacterized protein LOC125077951 [Vanessa atalanta]